MWKRVWVLITAAVLFTAACADSEEAGPQLKVDLEAVKRSGTVTPVNGLTTAGQPDEEALTVFAKQGYTTVIDLRAADEDRGIDEFPVVKSLGMDYIHFPIESLDAVSFESAAKLEELIAAADGPVLLHCASSNRVGALLALSKSLSGESDDTALAFGRKAGMTGLDEHVKEVLQKK